MASTTEQVKQRLSIVDVVSSYLRLEKAGINFKAKCPFHNERTPSFFVSPTRGSYHCFGCNRGGDIFSFVQEIERVEFIEALKILADRAGIVLPERLAPAGEKKARLLSVLEAATQFYQLNLKEGAAAYQYLIGRAVGPEAIKEFRIGFAPDQWQGLFDHLKSSGFKENEIEAAGLIVAGQRSYYDRFRGRIMFPIADFSGRVIGFSGRLLPEVPTPPRVGIPTSPEANVGSKYINTSQTVLYDKSRAVFGLDKAKEAIRQADQVIFVEGQMDVVLAHQAGTKNVVGVSGTALTKDHLNLVSRLSDKVMLILDPDEAGLKASGRLVLEVLSQGLAVSLVVLPEGQDPADIAGKSPERWRKFTSEALPFIDFAILALERRGLSSRELFAAIRSEIYPYLKVMRWDLERDEAFGKIADFINSSVDALRADFLTWSKLSLVPPGRDKWEVEPSAVSPAAPSSRRELIILRLLGLILWQEAQVNRVIDTVAARKKLEEVLGQAIAPALEADKEKLVFETEAAYSGSAKLSEEANLLLRHLEEEILKEKLNENLVKLRAAEKKPSAAETDKLLAECQEITNQIRKLQLSR